MDALRARGAYVWKNHGSVFMTAGLPDIVGVYCGDFIAVETKMPGKENTVSEVQHRVHDHIRAAGGRVIVATSVRQALTVLDP